MTKLKQNNEQMVRDRVIDWKFRLRHALQINLNDTIW